MRSILPSPVVRYERDAPGELLHMDTKKLGCIVRPSHRITGDGRYQVDGAGREFAHMAIAFGPLCLYPFLAQTTNGTTAPSMDRMAPVM